MGGGEEGGEGEKGHYRYARGDEFVIEKAQGGGTWRRRLRCTTWLMATMRPILLRRRSLRGTKTADSRNGVDELDHSL